jgi:hypothetical protein
MILSNPRTGTHFWSRRCQHLHWWSEQVWVASFPFFCRDLGHRDRLLVLNCVLFIHCCLDITVAIQRRCVTLSSDVISGAPFTTLLVAVTCGE